MSARKLSIAGVIDRFPDFRVAVVTVDWPGGPATRSDAAAQEIAAREAACRARWAGVELSAIPGVAAWRTAYRGFGVKKTSYRSSVERLVKRVIAGEGLPVIHPLVDLYNAVSLTHVLCVGADDLDRVAGDLAFRFALPGDSFVDMAAAEGDDPNDPPKQGEVVYACDGHVLCRRWNWRQDARSVVGPASRRVIVTLQSHGEGSVEAAAEDLVGWAERELRATCRVAAAERGRETVAIG
ncbi:MAG: hypothetical protein JNK46_10565 [Methylobacteriaceae bacterium]|nr:hypothetical protein [Methylobacteriaceae bacterium]